MSRRDELIKAIGDKTLTPMVDEMVYLEEQLDMLRGLPKIKVHPKDPRSRRLHLRPRCTRSTCSSI